MTTSPAAATWQQPPQQASPWWPSGSAAAPGAAAVAAHALGLPRIGKGLAESRQFVFDPATQIGVGIDPGVTQAVSAASGVRDVRFGQLGADQLARWKLTKGQVKHASGLNNAHRPTERWLAPIKPHLQHLAAASSAGISLVANLKHITFTLATWDAVWEVYKDPKWAQQRLRLYETQDRALEKFFKKLEEDMAKVSMERHGRAKQLVVSLAQLALALGVSSAVNGQQPCERQLNKRRATRPADWKPTARPVEPRLVRPAWSQQRDQPVRGLMWCPVVPPRKPPQAPRSSQAATHAAASEPGPSTPLQAKRSKCTKAVPAAEPTQPTKAAKAKPAPQPGRWLDRDCSAALNMQRIGESRWRPLELCWWPEQGKLPAKGKEYPGLGYKRLRDKPPNAQQQQQQQQHPALDAEAADVSQRRWGTCKQLVVFCGKAGIGTWGGWGANAVLRACRKVGPNSSKPTDRLPGTVMTVNEFRTSREQPPALREMQMALACPQIAAGAGCYRRPDRPRLAAPCRASVSLPLAEEELRRQHSDEQSPSAYVRPQPRSYAPPSISSTPTLRPSAEWFPVWMRYRSREENYVFWEDKFKRNSIDVHYAECRWTLFSTFWYLVVLFRFQAVPPALRFLLHVMWRAVMMKVYEAHKAFVLWQAKLDAHLARRATEGRVSAFSKTMALRRLHWQNNLVGELMYLVNVTKTGRVHLLPPRRQPMQRPSFFWLL
ncbi:hypothetical protein QJQ45_021866 [Haematococcus lacustris]|nr:hypothetical protein QJQ45_021866 [Haematococcus lacustris]